MATKVSKSTKKVAKTGRARKELPYEKNRKRAAKELYQTTKAYEKVSEDTIYRHCFYGVRHGSWRYLGRAHAYTW